MKHRKQNAPMAAALLASTLIVLGAAPKLANAADLKTGEDTLRTCQESADLFGRAKYAEAFDLWAPHWAFPKQELKSLAAKTISIMDQAKSRFGKPLAAEFLYTESTGESLQRHMFLIKHEKHALRFSCLVYKPADTWVVNSIKWDDKITLFYKE